MRSDIFIISFSASISSSTRLDLKPQWLLLPFLSASELDAVRYILEELDGREGILVASKIADRVGITRSVIVNALRKLESAEVIESRSSGMKGTYIRVINDLILDELKEEEE